MMAPNRDLVDPVSGGLLLGALAPAPVVTGKVERERVRRPDLGDLIGVRFRSADRILAAEMKGGREVLEEWKRERGKRFAILREREGD
ncbi:hypothetical protein TIFTF001_035651 [Ficus carica]|uniref:Uncharacterized protein n=1 Tax=Ficus carica TaxID=3494 RepID=A0AA88E2S9_FICCA|nr:hypothetical protein TIFTF001_035651 [Ficus carica]